MLSNLLNIDIKQMKNRVLWADIAKAIAIFCIIWGHAGSGSEVILFRNVLYSFHIIVFLIVSGFLMNFPSEEKRNIKGVGEFLLKNILKLVVPYIFWSIFFCNFTISNVWPLLYGSYESIKTVNVIGALWFVPCFFVARTLVYFTMLVFSKLKLKQLFLGIMGVGYFAIGFILPLLDKGYVWSVNISFVLAGFMIIGFLCKPLLELLSKSKWWIILLVFIISFTCFYFGTLFRKEEFELVCMYNGRYGNKFWLFYNGIFGAISVISISMLLAKLKNKFTLCIQYIGMQTLGLLFFHVPFIRQVMMPFFNKIGFTSPLWLVAMIAGLCTLIVCLIFDFLVVLVCPELVGKKRIKND